jgi:hypothetical protein
VVAGGGVGGGEASLSLALTPDPERSLVEEDVGGEEVVVAEHDPPGGGDAATEPSDDLHGAEEVGPDVPCDFPGEGDLL